MKGSANYERKVAKGYTIDLNSYAANWPTATANDHKGSSQPGQRRGQLREAAEQKYSVGRQAQEESGGELQKGSTRRLNPGFVEWLMGFPSGWISFERWGMESFPSRQRPR